LDKYFQRVPRTIAALEKTIATIVQPTKAVEFSDRKKMVIAVVKNFELTRKA
jgi:hypothetical protein